MKNIAVTLGTVLALFPNVRYLVELQYQFDPALEHSICSYLACSEDFFLDSAERLAAGGDQDKEIALVKLQEAVRRNVASPYRWCNLGEALLRASRIEEARHCYLRAAELGPENPAILWRVADFYRKIQDTNRSHEYLVKMLDLTPTYHDLVFDIFLSSQTRVQDVLEYGMSGRPQLAKDYFRYLLAYGTAEVVSEAWQWLEDHSITDEELSRQYADFVAKKSQ